MTVVHFIVWGSLLLAAALAVFLGRRTRGMAATFGIALVLAFVTFMAVNAGLAACASSALCPHLGDAGITYAILPLLALPILWLLTAIGSKIGRNNAAEHT